MKATTEPSPAVSQSGSGRKGISPVTAAVVLVVTLAIAGAASFAVLSATSHTSSNHLSSCAPTTAPQCGGHGNTNDVRVAHSAADVLVSR
jgi:hypothetical protein